MQPRPLICSKTPLIGSIIPHIGSIIPLISSIIPLFRISVGTFFHNEWPPYRYPRKDSQNIDHPWAKADSSRIENTAKPQKTIRIKKGNKNTLQTQFFIVF